MVIKASKYQQAVYDFTNTGIGDLIVKAVAGAGKTTTLVGMANLLPETTKAIFLAFNKSIQLELADRLPAHMMSKTYNSFGLGILSANGIRASLENYKYGGSKGIVPTLISQLFPNISDEEKEELASVTPDYVDMVRLNLTGPKNQLAISKVAEAFNKWGVASKEDLEVREEFSGELINLAADYDLSVLSGLQHDRLCRLVINALVVGIDQALGKGKIKNIDFNDQVWLPVILKLPTTQYDFVMIDEAQDLNRCQLNLVSKARRDGGRMVFVGDPNQSIYLFAGADCNSMDRIKQVTGAHELPLSVCYRCPTSHIDLASSIYPGIEAAPGKDRGELKHDVELDLAIRMAKPSEGKHLETLFICRNTAPLIKVAYRMIREGKPAKVRGKKIGEGLNALVKRIEGWSRKNGYGDFRNFNQALDSYLAAKSQEAKESLKEEKIEAAIDSLTDKIETIRVIYLAKKPESIEALKVAITSMFDDKGSTIWLSSVHKAKGLEANDVFIIDPHLMPSKYAKTPQARQQEQNIIYVAVTRAKKGLYFLRPMDDTAADNELAANA